jgi:glycine/D-amino acid oxidase-like deaminating enzyme
MRPPQLPSTLGSIATRIGLTIGGGGAGSLAALALIHRHGTTAVAAGAVTVAFAAHVAESASKTLPAIITAISNLLSARTRARADAKATIILATTRAELAQAGLDPNQTAQAAEMQRQLSANPDLPKDRRPTDETLIKLQGGHRTRNNSVEPGIGPDTPGNGARTPRTAANKVVPIRSDN